MRSLIILEVEHDETTDDPAFLASLIDDGTFDRTFGVTVTDYTVRVDLPPCFVLD